MNIFKKKNADIAKKIRLLKEQGQIKATWTNSCKVFIKTKDVSENARILWVRPIDQLDQRDIDK